MMTVGELLSILAYPPDFEFVYTGSDRDYDNMFPHFVSGMSEEFYAVIMDCTIDLIDCVNSIIELDGKMVYDELLAYRMMKNAICTDPIIDFNSLYPNILDSPE